MTDPTPVPKRFIGLDVHKHYLIATGVDAEQHPVLGPQRVEFFRLDIWMEKTLSPEDALVLEMTTNTWQIYDDLLPHVQSITVVHPPHVALITRAQVMTDKIAAITLARLLVKGLLVGIWVPPKEVQQLRALIAQRTKMTRLATQAKNRLHSLLHSHHLFPPEGDLFQPERRVWWEQFKLDETEKRILACDDEVSAITHMQFFLLKRFRTVNIKYEVVLIITNCPSSPSISSKRSNCEA